MQNIAFTGTAARRPAEIFIPPVTYNLGILPDFFSCQIYSVRAPRIGNCGAGEVNLGSPNISFGNFLENDFCNPPPLPIIFV